MSGYAKVFGSLFDGSLRGHPDEILVFINMLCHAGPDGVVDRHWRAISDETGLSVDRVKAASLLLAAPDPESRTPDCDGRRIVLLDAHRDWGWRIVNHAKYRDLCSRMQATERKRRERSRDVTHMSRSSVTGCDLPEDEDADASESGSQRGTGGAKPDLSTIAGVKVALRAHDSFRSVPDMGIENALKTQPDRSRWPGAIRDLLLHYTGANIPVPCRTLCNYLAGKAAYSGGSSSGSKPPISKSVQFNPAMIRVAE